MSGPVGHEILASLGKKRLRPGGKRVTDWLLGHIDFSGHPKVLEVACNQGVTMLELAQRGAEVIGLDLSRQALNKARVRLSAAGVRSAQLVEGDATALPFEDDTFDVVVNEAMLTMLPPARRHQALTEYCRVLKKGGILLTHDVTFIGENPASALSRGINIPVQPERPEEWERQIREAGFVPRARIFPFSLLNLPGLIRDEGVFNTLRILWRARCSPLRPQFEKMRDTFKACQDTLRAIGVVSRK